MLSSACLCLAEDQGRGPRQVRDRPLANHTAQHSTACNRGRLASELERGGVAAFMLAYLPVEGPVQLPHKGVSHERRQGHLLSVPAGTSCRRERDGQKTVRLKNGTCEVLRLENRCIDDVCACLEVFVCVRLGEAPGSGRGLVGWWMRPPRPDRLRRVATRRSRPTAGSGRPPQHGHLVRAFHPRGDTLQRDPGMSLTTQVSFTNNLRPAVGSRG